MLDVADGFQNHVQLGDVLLLGNGRHDVLEAPVGVGGAVVVVVVGLADAVFLQDTFGSGPLGGAGGVGRRSHFDSHCEVIAIGIVGGSYISGINERRSGLTEISEQSEPSHYCVVAFQCVLNPARPDSARK